MKDDFIYGGCFLLAVALCSGNTIKESEPTTGLRAIVKDGDTARFIPVPLKSVDISTRLVNFVAEVRVTQTYQNVEVNPIECEYMFPVEETAAVVAFKADLEGRKIVSKVKQKEEAVKEYKEAVSEGKTSFLVEEVRPDILQINVGSLSPGATCTISLTYITEADLDDGNIRLTIPTTISPKYVPINNNATGLDDDTTDPRDDTTVEKIKSIKYDYSSPAPLTFSVHAQMKTNILNVTSPSHDVTTQSLGKQKDNLFHTNINLQTNTTDLDRDIVILVKSEAASQSLVLREEGDESNVLMVSISPKLKLTEDPKVDIVFLVDCSGSMRGSSMKLARNAMNTLIHSLPSTAYFNIFRFGSNYESVFNASVPYTDDNLDIAQAVMETMTADMGGTEILAPLQTILEEESFLPRKVFVLTDGSVYNSEEVISLARQYNTDKKVFTLGIGSAADRHLVKGLARAGKGTSDFTVEGELIAPKVIKQLKNILQPNLNNINIDWGSSLDDSTSSQAPSSIPPLYNGSRAQIFKLLANTVKVPRKLKITAKNTIDGDTYSEEIAVDDSTLKGDLLHKMFARKMIQDLQENNEESTDIEAMVTKLALKYQLMSEYTSFVAVDSKSNKSSLAMESRSIINQVPKGFGVSLPAAFAANPVVVRSGSRPQFRPQFLCAGCNEDNYDYSDDTDTPISKVEELISFQSTMGYFTNGKQIIELLELTEAEVEKIGAGIDEKTLYTLLVLTAFEERFKDLKSSWDLVGSKAEKYLGQQKFSKELPQKIVSLLNKSN